MQAIGRQPRRAPDGAPLRHRRHRPEQTTLYRLVQEHAASFIAHLHRLGLDGVHRCDADGVPAFVETDAPNDDALHALLQTLMTRLMQLLTHRGLLVEDMGRTCVAEPDADGDEARTLRPLQAAAITCRTAFGPRAGQKVLTL